MIKEYLVQTNLQTLDRNLSLVKSPALVHNVSIDILAKKYGVNPVGIKVKEGEYNSSSLIGHVFQYKQVLGPESDIYVVCQHFTPSLLQSFQHVQSVHLYTLNPDFSFSPTPPSSSPVTPSHLKDVSSSLEQYARSAVSFLKRKLLE